jgi:hypothetical protein
MPESAAWKAGHRITASRPVARDDAHRRSKKPK